MGTPCWARNGSDSMAIEGAEPLSATEVNQVTELLSRLDPGFLPFPIFHQVTRIAATPIVEVVPLRMTSDGNVEVLLLRRPDDDPVWPSQLHTPGTVVRGSDAPGSFNSPLRRILSGELNGTTFSSPPTFVRSSLDHSGRGVEVAQIYWIEVDQASCGVFYDARRLPVDLVVFQAAFIQAAVEDFRAKRM